jgi:hypothetical protein
MDNINNLYIEENRCIPGFSQVEKSEIKEVDLIRYSKERYFDNPDEKVLKEEVIPLENGRQKVCLTYEWDDYIDNETDKLVKKQHTVEFYYIRKMLKKQGRILLKR